MREIKFTQKMLGLLARGLVSLVILSINWKRVDREVERIVREVEDKK